MATKKNEMKRGAYTKAVQDIMNAGKNEPMAVVSAKIAAELGMTMSYARAWYRDFVTRELAPGAIEKAPTRKDTAVLMAKALGLSDEDYVAKLKRDAKNARAREAAAAKKTPVSAKASAAASASA